MFREREEVERQILVYWKARRSGPRLWKTSTIHDGRQKSFGRGRKERAHATLDSLPAEALCSGGLNCKRNICQRGCFKLLGGKLLLCFFFFYLPWAKGFFAYLCKESTRVRWTISRSVILWLGKNKVSSRRWEMLHLNAGLGKKKCETTSWETSQPCLEHFSEGICVKIKESKKMYIYIYAL